MRWLARLMARLWRRKRKPKPDPDLVNLFEHWGKK